MAEHAAARWTDDGAFDALAVDASTCRAGSMPRALRFQEGWTFFADLSESTTLVLSERIAERSIVRNESSVQ